MRIVITRSNPIQPDSRVEKEVESLIKDGHEIIILGWDRSKKYNIATSKLYNQYGEATIHRFGIPGRYGDGIKNIKALYLFQRRTYKWLDTHIDEYDAIHACDLDNGVVARKAARKHGKIFVYDIFDYYSACHNIPFGLAPLVKKLENHIINKANVTIICSEQRIEQIKGSKPKKIVVIHNAPYMGMLKQASETFSLQSNKEKRRIKIGYVGILGRTRLLEEMLNCIEKRDDVELHIGGFGQLEALFVNASQKSNKVFFYGKLSYPDALKLENEMDILTAIYDPNVPNHRFAAPNKFYEALMLGKPLIMVHNTGMDCVIDENGFGVTIDFSEQGLNDGIDKLLSTRTNWKQIGECEKKMFAQNYSWDIMGERLQALYRDL